MRAGSSYPLSSFGSPPPASRLTPLSGENGLGKKLVNSTCSGIGSPPYELGERDLHFGGSLQLQGWASSPCTQAPSCDSEVTEHVDLGQC